jgi:hypothetical protein
MMQTREYVDQNEGSPSAVLNKAYQNATSRFHKRKQLAGNGKNGVLRSSLACIHFETVPGMTYHRRAKCLSTGKCVEDPNADKEEGVEIPLEKKIVTYRGMDGFYPNEEYNWAVGTSVFYHNKAENAIDFYAAFSYGFDFYETASGFQAQVQVGKMDGATGSIPSEGRAATPEATAMGVGALSSVHQLPVWYPQLYASQKRLGCDIAKFKAASGDMVQTVADPNRLMSDLLVAASCATEYLKPDCTPEGQNIVPLNPMQAMVFAHFFM